MTASLIFGPWRASAPAKPTPDAPAGGDIAILDSAGNIIAECFVWVNEAQTVDAAAHARLIVGAPELLAALQTLVDRNLGYESGFVDRRSIRIQDVYAARRVIAKVLGKVL